VDELCDNGLDEGAGLLFFCPSEPPAFLFEFFGRAVPLFLIPFDLFSTFSIWFFLESAACFFATRNFVGIDVDGSREGSDVGIWEVGLILLSTALMGSLLPFLPGFTFFRYIELSLSFSASSPTSFIV